ncbi:MAG: filament integrity protein FraC [Cyanobacteria bacterium P01_H01_bin.58]
MPFSLLIGSAAVLPLRAIIFQSLLLVVAIALEAIVLRQRLKLGFQPSIRYATCVNLLSVILGWILFLGIEPLLPEVFRTQVISYVLFGQFYANAITNTLGPILVGTGLVIFFLTFAVKVKALEWLTWILGSPVVKPVEVQNVNRFRYRKDITEARRSPHSLAVLQANALSFSAILLLLLLRDGVG